MEQSFIAYIENSIKENWDLDALTDYKGATLQYKDVNGQVLQRLKSRGSLPNGMESARTAGKAARVQH